MSDIRDASCLLLVSDFYPYSKNKINLLTIIRSNKCSYYPGACVFPGGNVDLSDKNQDWLSVIPNSEINLPLKIIDAFGQEKSVSPLPAGEVSEALFLKICAIRETFEECGILLCKKYVSSNCTAISHLEIPDKHLWRKKVRFNGEQFLRLCQINECYPDVNNLHLWSNWCSPSYLDRRYDTKYYFAVVTTKVSPEPDEVETESAQWKTADECLLENERQYIFLPPSQFYELCRIQRFTNVETLIKFARKHLRDNYCQQYVPQEANTKDGIIILLPGDEKYVECSKMRPAILYINEDMKSGKKRIMHRIVIKHNGIYQCCVIIQNYKLPVKHVLPKSMTNLNLSKL